MECLELGNSQLVLLNCFLPLKSEFNNNFLGLFKGSCGSSHVLSLNDRSFSSDTCTCFCFGLDSVSLSSGFLLLFLLTNQLLFSRPVLGCFHGHHVYFHLVSCNFSKRVSSFLNSHGLIHCAGFCILLSLDTCIFNCCSVACLDFNLDIKLVLSRFHHFHSSL